MEFEFFPSRTLELYLVRLFITRIVGVLLMLVMVLMILDLLGESGDILAPSGNGEAQLLHYVSLRVPQLIARFLPYSVLLATIITLATLNQNSEVISMKAAGLSAHQVLAPLILAALGIAAVSFVFNETVVTRATASLEAWKAVEYGPIPRASSVRDNVYLADGSHILASAVVTDGDDGIHMRQVTYYRRNSRDMIVEQIRAPSASYAAPGWKLVDAVRFDVAGTTSEKLASVTVAPGITPEQVRIIKVDADENNIVLHQNAPGANAGGET